MAALWNGSIVAMALAGVIAAPGRAAAQRQDTQRIAVEATVGRAGFVDDSTIDDTVVGGGLRVSLTSRLSVGPEVVYGVGPHAQRNLFVLGSLWYDLAPAGSRVVPYVVAGGGWYRHRETVGTGPYTTGEGTFTAGGGVRVHLNERVYVGGDARVGWELHLRTAAQVGVTWPRR